MIQDKPMDQNLIEEIYKFREGLKEIGVATAPSESIQISDIIKEKEEQEKKETTQVPSESQVDNMTEELLKQRETREILDEAIKNTTYEASQSQEQDEPKDFNDMYNDFFGRSGVKEDESEYVPLDDENMAKINEIREAVKGNKNTQIIEKPDAFVQRVSEDTNIVPYEQTNNETIDEFKNMKNSNYKFIGIVFDTYIIVQIENEMYIIDQHAAHERIRYEIVKKNYYSDVNKDCQMMLLPDVIELTHKEVETIKENVDMFEKAGFDLEAFGENTIKLNGVPSFCIDMNTKHLFLELLDDIGEFSRTARQEKEDHFLATIACKSAVKAKMKLGKEEVDALMNELLELPNPFTCPHGRPTAIKMSKYDLEKNFRRIM